ncbi:hypothetical protein CEXT_721591 [Caerostris extrusa]|uniref:Uncharacterized protein n=1 Tax=Caerostris extrusa TaxID=172846 RepID=A0AAV4M394_CAEEX|nr:hypothetical protein CEXT_721591 [Caerostris extrusa]
MLKCNKRTRNFSLRLSPYFSRHPQQTNRIAVKVGNVFQVGKPALCTILSLSLPASCKSGLVSIYQFVVHLLSRHCLKISSVHACTTETDPRCGQRHRHGTQNKRCCTTPLWSERSLVFAFGVSGEIKEANCVVAQKCLEFAFSILRCLEDIYLQWNLPPLFIIIVIILLLLWRGS